MANNNILEDHTDLLEVVIYDVPAKGLQYRLAVSEFRGVHYLSIREWYAAYDNQFAPSTNGFTVPYTLHSVSGLFKALTTLLCKAEVMPEVLAEREVLESFIKSATLTSLISKELALPFDKVIPDNLVSFTKTENSITLTFNVGKDNAEK